MFDIHQILLWDYHFLLIVAMERTTYHYHIHVPGNIMYDTIKGCD
jgi:hypothetical protein